MSTFEGRLVTQLIFPKPGADPVAAGPESSAASTKEQDDVDALGADGGPVGGTAQETVEGVSGGSENRRFCAPPVERGFDTREREEAFMCVSLEVKDMIGVEDALEKFAEKEIIEGYGWDDEVRCVLLLCCCGGAVAGGRRLGWLGGPMLGVGVRVCYHRCFLLTAMVGVAVRS